MKNKLVRVVLSDSAQSAYRILEGSSRKRDESIFRSVKNKAELIKANPHYGEPVSKRLIPGKYAEMYGITNLFRVELANFWRLTYTLVPGDTGGEITAFVLDIFDHKEYDRLFGYKKK